MLVFLAAGKIFVDCWKMLRSFRLEKIFSYLLYNGKIQE